MSTKCWVKTGRFGQNTILKREGRKHIITNGNRLKQRMKRFSWISETLFKMRQEAPKNFSGKLKKFLEKCLTNERSSGKICLRCVGNTTTHCDDAGDCGLAGNFRGVCPVIGRLNCPGTPAYIAAPPRKRVGLASAIFHGLE